MHKQALTQLLLRTPNLTDKLILVQLCEMLHRLCTFTALAIVLLSSPKHDSLNPKLLPSVCKQKQRSRCADVAIGDSPASCANCTCFLLQLLCFYAIMDAQADGPPADCARHHQAGASVHTLLQRSRQTPHTDIAGGVPQGKTDALAPNPACTCGLGACQTRQLFCSFIPCQHHSALVPATSYK